MGDRLSFRLFGSQGYVNPSLPLLPLVYDPIQGAWFPKQNRSFDGAWRWFSPADISVITIYNLRLDKRAFADITYEEIEDTVIGAEFILKCAQYRALTEHNFWTALDHVHDHLFGLANHIRQQFNLEEQ